MRLREEDHLERARDLKEELDVMEAGYWTNRDRRWEHADQHSYHTAYHTFGATYSSPWRGIEAPAPLPAAASPRGGVLPVPFARGLVANASREGAVSDRDHCAMCREFRGIEWSDRWQMWLCWRHRRFLQNPKQAA